MRSKLAERNLSHLIRVVSAGVIASAQRPLETGTLLVCQKKGLDISGHTPRLIERSFLEDANHIFCMTWSHVNYIREKFPDLAHKIQLFNLAYQEKTEGNPEVEDPGDFPYNGDNFENCYETLCVGVERILGYLEPLVLERAKRTSAEEI